ncbi:putative Protein tyrosine phosphatase, dual specificity [Balamuthia mandrillaris]
MKTRSFVVGAVCAVALLALVVGTAHAKAGRCAGVKDGEVPHIHFVDKSSTVKNWLVRGGNPDVIDDSQFDYNALVRGILAAAKRDNVDLPQPFFLIDINLENIENDNKDTDDSHHVMSEYEFFEANPSKGLFLFWQTLGTTNNISTPYFTPSFKNYLMKSFPQWMGDDIIQRMQTLRALLATSFGMPAVIYAHCDCGCDRTGELFGSYYMKWQNKTWEETNALNTNFAERPMECPNYLAMQWYCMYLREEEGMTWLNCLDNKACTPTNSAAPSRAGDTEKGKLLADVQSFRK